MGEGGAGIVRFDRGPDRAFAGAEVVAFVAFDVTPAALVGVDSHALA